MATVEQIRPIVKPTTVKHDSVKIFSANTRSLKGKTEEISNETFDYDIVCLTETHIDNTIQDHQIFDYNNKIIYRKDRNIYGGGVLIAVSESFTSKQITLANTDNTEILFVRVQESLLVGCYYRPHTDKDLAVLNIVIEHLQHQFPDDHLLLVGDMNLPGIDWLQQTIKPHSQDRKLHRLFLDILAQQNLQQLVDKPTHIHGNTLDLICTNQPEMVHT